MLRLEKFPRERLGMDGKIKAFTTKVSIKIPPIGISPVVTHLTEIQLRVHSKKSTGMLTATAFIHAKKPYIQLTRASAAHSELSWKTHLKRKAESSAPHTIKINNISMHYFN